MLSKPVCKVRLFLICSKASRFMNTVEPLILATLNFGVWVDVSNYFGPRNFGVFASYYTETLLYSNFRGPLFSRTCQAREIHEIKGTRKKRVLQYVGLFVMMPFKCSAVLTQLYMKSNTKTDKMSKKFSLCDFGIVIDWVLVVILIITCLLQSQSSN